MTQKPVHRVHPTEYKVYTWEYDVLFLGSRRSAYSLLTARTRDHKRKTTSIAILVICSGRRHMRYRACLACIVYAVSNNTRIVFSLEPICDWLSSSSRYSYDVVRCVTTRQDTVTADIWIKCQLAESAQHGRTLRDSSLRQAKIFRTRNSVNLAAMKKKPWHVDSF